MRDAFYKIANEYLIEKNKPVKDNLLFRYISSGVKNEIYDTGIIDKAQYIVKASAGNTQWANIPWIAIFDRDITNSARRGYYIVYLFSADMKKVYLSLNQGWTYYREEYKPKEGRKKIKIVSQMWKERLKSGLKDFGFNDINLEYFGKGTNLPKGYELGHICGKLYYLDNLPAEEILIQDLQKMLLLYRELKGNIINESYVDTNNYLISEYANKETNSEDEIRTKPNINIDSIIAKEGKGSKLVISDKLPDIKTSGVHDIERNYTKGTGQKINHQEKNKRQEKLGKAGEYFVIEHEKNKLKEHKIKKNVEHVAVTQKDKAGYDVKSYDENGSEIHIEVKTTSKGINEPFYLTRKELEHCKENKDKYYLYRLYNFNAKEKTSEYYILHGDISKLMNMETEVYKVDGRKLEE